MSDLQKYQNLSNFLANTLFPAVFAAFNQPGTRFIENRSKNKITLHKSLRLAIGMPQPAYLLGAGMVGIYELPNTAITSELYALQDDMAKNTNWTPEATIRKLNNPNTPKNIQINVLQVWEIGNFEPL